MKKCFSDPAVFKQLETDCYNAGCKGQVISHQSAKCLKTAFKLKLGGYAKKTNGEIG